MKNNTTTQCSVSRHDVVIMQCNMIKLIYSRAKLHLTNVKLKTKILLSYFDWLFSICNVLSGSYWHNYKLTISDAKLFKTKKKQKPHTSLPQYFILLINWIVLAQQFLKSYIHKPIDWTTCSYRYSSMGLRKIALYVGETVLYLSHLISPCLLSNHVLAYDFCNCKFVKIRHSDVHKYAGCTSCRHKHTPTIRLHILIWVWNV